MKHATLLLAALLGLSQCKKKDPDPLSQLPPATQTGANTFGCLIDGKAWTPKGRVGLGDNLYFEYDPTFNGGTLGVQVYRVGDGRKQYIEVVQLSETV
ncbi:hypothetical protein [Hymenobacter rubripertinctus]|uniref:Uncharacterized protein n=1 Tax=Hymenobacter rubripertinctus TaxID=2029981 RepID=A0A418QRL3_9BACT|nr:hypothetical protein [Hymenobacter rubripertinctus]RIY07909.1 hypothetical protein D0T11_15135 [Hymenobacter rubripertinctus]